MKAFSILLILNLLFSPIALAKSKKDKSKSQYNIRELALPSEVENIGKKSGSIYYSPSVKGKVLIPVHFWGQVKNSGLHFLPVDTNIINGISLAGGPANNAELDNIKVTTKRTGKREKLKFDLSGGGAIDLEDFKLQPGDTVFVPEDTFRQDRNYYTSLTGVILTLLSSILIYQQVKE